MKVVLKAENVWDSPAQAAVMVQIALAYRDEHEYSVIGKAQIARRLGVNRRYIKRILEQLEYEKEAIVPYGQEDAYGGRVAGQRNRYKLTLERCFAKVRREAGADDDVPLSELPPRSTRAKARKAIVDRGDPRIPPVDADAGRNDHARVPRDPQGGDPGILRGRIPGSSEGDPGILPVATDLLDVLDQKEATGADAPAAPRLPLLGLSQSQLAAKAQKERRQRLYARVSGKARELLRNPILGCTFNIGDPKEPGTPIETPEDLVNALKWYCARQRIAGAGDVVAAAAASEWFKHRNRAVIEGREPRPRDRARWRRSGGR